MGGGASKGSLTLNEVGLPVMLLTPRRSATEVTPREYEGLEHKAAELKSVQLLGEEARVAAEEARAAALSLYDIYSESGSLSATVPDVRRLVSSFLNSFTGLSLKQ